MVGTREGARLGGDEGAFNEIGYVYTVLLSSLILSAVVVSVGHSVSAHNREVAEGQVTEMAARLAVAVEEALDQIERHPDQPLQRQVELIHQNFAYMVLAHDDRITVAEKTLHGSKAEIIIYNEMGINIHGRVESSARALIIEHLPDTGELLLRAPVSGT